MPQQPKSNLATASDRQVPVRTVRVVGTFVRLTRPAR
jgi:hypothetical protein